MKLPGMKKDLKPIPVFKQNEGEKNRQFFRRVNQQVTVSKVHTLSLKSLLPLVFVWSKTTLNTGGVGRAEADPQT